MTSSLSALFNSAKKVALVSVPVNEEPEKETVEEEDEEQAEADVDERPKKKAKIQREHEDPAIANAQTVFVGNVPSGCTQKQLKKLFASYGTVESVRLRNLIPLNPKRGKRLAFIKKEFHPLQKTITAFVRFSDEAEALNATELNGQVFKEHHLRVDMAQNRDEDAKHDNKRSIFIGNLPFDVSDEDVWKAFEPCGEIDSVRLVRDRATSVGKGFGYVSFRDEAAVGLALRMNDNCQVGNRQVRIKAAVKKPKPMKPVIPPKKYRRQNRKMNMRQFDGEDADEGTDGVQQGRVGKRPAVKLRKEKQKKKKKSLSTTTNSARKGVIQLKKKT